MTTNFNSLVEKYILGKLEKESLDEFLQHVESSKERSQEVVFQIDLTNAITEKDVMELRENLNTIINSNSTQTENEEDIFDLSNNLSSIASSKEKENNEFEIKNSLQFIHIENHKRSSTEQIHDLTPQESEFDDEQLWKEISASIQETDIHDLRTNLNNISHSMESKYSEFLIDQFINQELKPIDNQNIELSLKHDINLQEQVKLHHEIDEALSETDVSNLRASLFSIVKEEQQLDYQKIEMIDDYLIDSLDEKMYNSFEEILAEDIQLKNEVELNAEINEAIMENDVLELRETLSKMIENNENDSKVRRLTPKETKGNIRYLGAAASVAAVVSVGILSLNQQKLNSIEAYNEVYKPYEAAGVYRSSNSISPDIAGIDLYNRKKYNGAILQFGIILKDNPDDPMCNFYSGLSSQELGQYKKAISFYEKVIGEKDNLFIEQAEWYLALCYLQTENQLKAFDIFNQIIDKNKYYKKDAKAILKKMK